MTQRQTVLSMLRTAGRRGVSTGAFLSAHLPRFSARIEELRKEGYAIASQRLSASSWRFTLLSDPDAGRGALPTVADVAEGRFPPEPQSAPSSVREEQEALFEVAKQATKATPHWAA